jgi:hypothetical protein
MELHLPMPTAFENTCFATTVFALGAHWARFGSGSSYASVEALQQTPFGKSLGDASVTFDGKYYLFEFKRTRGGIKKELKGSAPKLHRVRLVEWLQRDTQESKTRLGVAARAHFFGYGSAIGQKRKGRAIWFVPYPKAAGIPLVGEDPWDVPLELWEFILRMGRVPNKSSGIPELRAANLFPLPQIGAKRDEFLDYLWWVIAACGSSDEPPVDSGIGRHPLVESRGGFVLLQSANGALGYKSYSNSEGLQRIARAMAPPSDRRFTATDGAVLDDATSPKVVVNPSEEQRKNLRGTRKL